MSLISDGCAYRLARVELGEKAATLIHTAHLHLTLTLTADLSVTVDREGRVDINNYGNFR